MCPIQNRHSAATHFLVDGSMADLCPTFIPEFYQTRAVAKLDAYFAFRIQKRFQRVEKTRRDRAPSTSGSDRVE